MLQNNVSVIDVMERGLQSPDKIAGSNIETQLNQAGLENEKGKNIIETKQLGFRFPDGEYLFKDLDIDIKRGERIGIKGKSGAGKSTLFNILLGFFPPSTGEIFFYGKKLTKENRKDWHSKVGYVPQEIFIIEGSLADNIALGRGEPDLIRLWEVLEQVNLKDWAQSLENGLETNLGEFGNRLSGGQKQRIGIARALYKGADVLFFDEATSSLDNDTEKEINKTLEELSRKHHELTMIVIAHRDSSLAFCNRILDLDNATIIDN